MNKYLELNLTKEVNDLYNEKYKICWKKLKKTEINGNMSCVHILEDLISLKCPYYPKWFAESMKSLLNSECYTLQK